MGEKQRRTIADTLAAVPAVAPRVLLATGRYIGEGFDDARLDAMFLKRRKGYAAIGYDVVTDEAHACFASAAQR